MSKDIEKLHRSKKYIDDILDSVFFELYSLNEVNKKLQAENETLREILKNFRDTKECSQTWAEEMHGTVCAVLEELGER